jgi:hypothetical protein
MFLEISTDMAIKTFLDVVDYLLNADKGKNSTLCAWTNKEIYANFKKTTFYQILKKQFDELDYVDYKKIMRAYRDMGWIVCQEERFTSTQWIKGKAHRVITVHHPRYLCLKKLEATKTIADTKAKQQQKITAS